MTLTLPNGLRRMLAVATILAALGLLMADCGDDGPSSPGGGWKPMASDSKENVVQPGAPIYKGSAFQCPFC